MDRAKVRRLSNLLWRDWLRSALPLVIVIALLLAGGVFILLDGSVTRIASVQGRVDSWSIQPGETGTGPQILWVTLDDGGKVMATASRDGRAPRNGERVELTEIHTGIGRIRYEWRRKEPPQL